MPVPSWQGGTTHPKEWRKDNGQPKAKARPKPQAKAKSNGARRNADQEADKPAAKTAWADAFFPSGAGPAAGGPTPAQAASELAGHPGRGVAGGGGRPAATTAPKAPSPFVESLWPNAWKATVLGPSKLEQTKENEQLVVAVRTEQQATKVLTWVEANPDSDVRTTLVFLGEPYSDFRGVMDVFLRNETGPVPDKAHVWQGQDNSPLTVISASADSLIKDDPIDSFEITDLRIQITKAFAPTLYDLAAKNLHHVPSIALKEEDCKFIKRVHSAQLYDDSTTCLVRMRKDVAIDWDERGPVHPGTFLHVQGTKGPKKDPGSKFVPITRPPGMDSEQYYKYVMDKAKAVNTRLILRVARMGKSGGDCLGICHERATLMSGLAHPRWKLEQAPSSWHSSDARTWLEGKGYKEVTLLYPSGQRTWTFQAIPAEGKHTGPGQTECYGSLLIVTPNTGNASNQPGKRGKPIKTAQVRWNGPPRALTRP